MYFFNSKRKTSILTQVAIIFALVTIVLGTLIFLSQKQSSDAEVKARMESLAEEVAGEVMMNIEEYPGYKWLLSYWHDHSEELDVEYDVEFEKGTRTEQKTLEFNQRHPSALLKYADDKDLQALSPEDQKLYAEIVYSWITTEINQIKRVMDIDYLFVVATEGDFDTQVFLFSGAEEGAKRGRDYEEVYTLGTTVTVADSQREAMLNAKEHNANLADAGDYMDYYAYMCNVDGRSFLVGLTYSLSGINADIDQQTTRGTALAVFFMVGLTLILLAAILQLVISPLKKVQENIRLYEKTKDGETVRAQLSVDVPGNEIGQLSSDVVSMTEKIDAYVNEIETITSERERIRTELDLASRIQNSTLPSEFPPFPERREFDIFASMDPAKEVGGDFFNFFMVDDDHLAFLIADVSGKGIPAALFMMVCNIFIQNAAQGKLSPAEALEQVNDEICKRNPQEMFVSVWLAVLEISTGKVTATNAGHEYPAIYTPGKGYELLKDKHGFVIGGMEGVRYKDYEVQLEKGSKLFVYTDGLAEATDKENNMFGIERMIDALNETCEMAPEETLKAVRARVDEFVKDAEQFDDLTMLCIEYKGN